VASARPPLGVTSTFASPHFHGFSTIGKRLGPFDAVLIETGAYNSLWCDVHLGPEQAIEARLALGSGLVIPVHWGTFNLGMHAWTEPVDA
jgi:L-ascorbate metabolism protein UlaG (beta-lactamase superfamily)